MRLSMTMVVDWIGDVAKKVKAVDLDGLSHSFTVESREAERMVFPRGMIPVVVIARACVMQVAVGVSVGRPAGRMAIAKPMPAVSSTKEEGKKRREEMALRWGFARFLRLEFARLG